MLFKQTKLTRAAGLLGSVIVLGACSVLPGAQQSTDTNQTMTASFASVQSSALQSAYDATLLAHRNAGEIAPSAFETKVRTAVRSSLSLDLAGVLDKQSETQLKARLAALDSALAKYKNASHKGSEFEQLWSLLPILPVIEERKAVKLVLQNKLGAEINSAADHMITMVDLQLNHLFNSFVISVDALTPETQVFEPLLVEKLTEQGLNISARRPSLILQYFIEMYDTDNGKEAVGDFELKDRSAKVFQSYSTEVAITSTASADAMAVDRIASELSNLMLEQALQRINDVNQYK
ncbi:hypothetical protein [Vibrio parahaemolyticus]|uniref:hypothetical protein n=1 Tax=Vibrio parahaemolyticus TaxID=670 RepID=UPI002EB2F440|nr:hypothetical protein [Pseudomonadota bacterium]